MSSRPIDEKIVELRLENSDFEQKARQSVQTFSDMNNAFANTNKIDLSSISKGVDDLNNKFSLTGTIARRAYETIADSIVGIGTKGVNVLQNMTFGGMRDGFAEYNSTIDMVKTLKNATGKSVKYINKQLDALNEYSDQTIYSYRDMVQNVTKFVNNGIPLKKAVEAIKGISNLAAISGANATEASRAMLNFSQALATGNMKLIDWKSITNASMDTLQFKKELLKTAVALGTVTKKGKYYYSTTKNGQGKVSGAFNATKEWNNALQYNFITSKVLTKTLRAYGNETTKIGKKAFAAAKQVTTFAKLKDTVFEAIGSQWAKVFRTVVGDLNEATKLWTSINDYLGAAIDAAGEAVKGSLEGWRKLKGRENLLSALATSWQLVLDILTPVAKLIQGLLPKSIEEASNKLSYFTLYVKSTVEALENIAEPISEAFGEVAKIIGEILSPLITLSSYISDIIFTLTKASLRPLAEVVGVIGQLIRIVWESGKAIINYFTPIGKIIDGIKKKIDSFISLFTKKTGTLSEKIKAIKNLLMDVSPDEIFKNLKKNFTGFFRYTGRMFSRGDMSITEYAQAVVKKIGAIIKNGLANIFNSKTWSKTFKAMGLSKLVKNIKNSLLVLSLKKNPVFKQLSDWVTILLSELIYLGKALKTAFDNSMFGTFFKNASDLGKSISDMVKDGALLGKIVQRIGLGDLFNINKDGKASVNTVSLLGTSVTSLTTKIQTLTTTIGGVTRTVKEKGLHGLLDMFTNWVKNAFTIDNVVKVIERIVEAIATVGFVAADVGAELAKKLLPTQLFEKLKNFRANLKKGTLLGDLANLFDEVRKMLKDGKSIGDVFKKIKESFNEAFVTKKGEGGIFNFKSVLLAIAGVLLAITVFKRLIPQSKGIFGNLYSLLTGGFSNITSGIASAGQGVEKLGAASKVAAIAAVIFSVKVLADAFKVLSEIKLTNLIPRMVGLLTFLALMGAITKRMGKAGNLAATGVMFFGLGNAIKQIASAVKTFSELDDAALDKGLTAFWRIIGMLSIMIGVAGYFKTPSTLSSIILSFGISLNLIALALKSFASLDPQTFKAGRWRIIQVIAILTIATNILSFRSKRLMGIAATIMALSTSLIIFFGAIALFALMDPKVYTNGLLKVIFVLGAMAAAITLIGLSGNAKVFKGVAAVIATLAASLVVMAGAMLLLNFIKADSFAYAWVILVSFALAVAGIAIVLSKLSDSNVKALGPTLLMMAGAFAIMAIAIGALSLLGPLVLVGVVAAAGFAAIIYLLGDIAKKTNGAGMIKLGAMLILLGGSFAVFAYSLKMIAQLPWETVIAAMGGFTLILFVLSAFAEFAGKSGSNLLMIAGGMLMLSVSFIAFAYALQMLQNVKPATIAIALGTFAGAMLAMVLLGQLLKAGAFGFLSFAAAMLALSIAVATVTWALSKAAPVIGPVINYIGEVLQNGFGGLANSVLPVIEGLWNSIAGVFNTIGNGLKMFGNFFGGLFGDVTKTVDDGAASLKGSTDKLKGITPVGTGIGATGVDAGSTASITSAFKQMTSASDKGSKEAAEKVSTNMESAKTKTHDAISSFGTMMKDSTGSAASSITSGFDVMSLSGKDGVNNVVDTISSGFSSGSKDINETLNSFTSSLGNDVDLSSLGGLTDKIDLSTKEIPDVVTKNVSSGSGKVKKASKKLAKDSKDAIKSEWKNVNLGQYLTKGCIKGLDSSTVETKARNLAKNAIEAMKEELGVHSPSKIAEQLFRYVAEGGALGLDHGSSDLITSARKMSSGALNEIASLLDEDFATKFTPEVSPILDMDAMNGINSSLSRLNANVGLRAPNIQNGFGMSNGTEVNGVSVNVNITTTGKESPEDIAKIARKQAQDVITTEVRKLVWR